LGIDRIGKGASSPPEALTPKEGAARGERPATSFEVTHKEHAPVSPSAQAGAVKASTALEGIRSGALDMNGYLDAKVDEATAHLTHLSPAQLEAVKGVVRSQIVADPHLAELVQQATGNAVPKDEE